MLLRAGVLLSWHLAGEPRDAMRSGQCHWTTLLAAACTGASPGYLVARQLLTLTLTRCGTSQQDLALDRAAAV